MQRIQLLRSCNVLTHIAALLMFAASSLSAQAALEEVIVTAQKRAQSVQDVPISISAISGEQLRISGAGNLEGLSDALPNVDVSDSPGLTRVVIRGLGSGTGNAAFEQSVGMFVDGIYASRAALFQAPFLDLNRIEVLKGPQGVLFGKNSIAGALSLVSNRPTEHWEAEVTGNYDVEYGSREVEGFISGPLLETFNGRLAVRTGSEEPYMDNITLADETPATETDVIRGTLQWDVADSTTLVLKAETSVLKEQGTNWQVYADYSEGTFPELLENSADYTPPTASLGLGADIYNLARLAGENFASDDFASINEREYLEQSADNVILEINHAPGDYELIYLFGYGQYNRDQFSDQDFTVVSVAATLRQEHFKQTSHELRIASPKWETFEFIAGLYYLDRELDIDTDQDGLGFNTSLSFSSDAAYREDSTSYAAFGQATWRLNDRLRASLGLRYSYEEKKASNHWFNRVYQTDESLALNEPARYALLDFLLNRRDFAYRADRDEDSWDPAFNIQWDFAQSSMAYFSLVQASKAGGFNTNEGSGDLDIFEFGPETARSVEVGVKAELLEGRARVNAAIFSTEFEDLQVGAFDPAVNGFVVRNAARALSQGLEVDGLFAVTDRLRVGATAAYLKAQYREFTASCPANWVEAAKLDCYQHPTGAEGNLIQDLEGVQLDNAPEVTGSMFADFTVPITPGLLFGGRVDASYKDKTSLDFSQDSNLFEKGYWRFNLRLSLTSIADNWSLALTAFNLTDEQAVNFAGQEFLLPAVYWENRSRGRELQLSASYRFGG